jgi:DeoR/GlpR family transcriptional regulator of sugar metabolism
VEERARIARAAIPLIRDARVLMIGSGATTVHLARRIAVEMKNLTVITHSFGVATVLSINPTIRVMIAPGTYVATEGATVGAHTLEFLQRFHADAVVTGASGLGPDGPSDALIDIAAVYAAMSRQAARHVVVADHSKFEQIFAAVYAPWQGIDTLVTDAPPARALAERLAQGGVSLTLS